MVNETATKWHIHSQDKNFSARVLNAILSVSCSMLKIWKRLSRSRGFVKMMSMKRENKKENKVCESVCIDYY